MHLLWALVMFPPAFSATIGAVTFVSLVPLQNAWPPHLLPTILATIIASSTTTATADATLELVAATALLSTVVIDTAIGSLPFWLPQLNLWLLLLLLFLLLGLLLLPGFYLHYCLFSSHYPCHNNYVFPYCC